MSEPITVEQMDAARTPKGGWTAKTLAKWGVPWPPPSGWRKTILEHGIPYDQELNTFAKAPDKPEAPITEEGLRRIMDASVSQLIEGEPFGVEGDLDIDPVRLLRKVVTAVIDAGHASDLYEFPDVLAFFGSRISEGSR